MKFYYSENLGTRENQWGFDEPYYEYRDFTDDELTEKFGILHNELSEEEFLNIIESNVIVVGNNNNNYIFDENRKYYGTFNGNRRKFKGYGLIKLKDNRYTKSQYLIESLKYYKTVNMKNMNEKMKEIMK